MVAWSTKPSASSWRAFTQIGHNNSRPPAWANCSNSRASGGQPSQATPTAWPGSARRTASLVRNIATSRARSSARPAQDHRDVEAALQRRARDEEGDGHALRVLETCREVDQDLLRHPLSLS